MLPKIDVPIYEVKLISSGKKLRFRPFTVKEEKLFLMANEAEDINTVLDTIKQVINNCLLSLLLPFILVVIVINRANHVICVIAVIVVVVVVFVVVMLLLWLLLLLL